MFLFSWDTCQAQRYFVQEIQGSLREAEGSQGPRRNFPGDNRCHMRQSHPHPESRVVFYNLHLSQQKIYDHRFQLWDFKARIALPPPTRSPFHLPDSFSSLAFLQVPSLAWRLHGWERRPPQPGGDLLGRWRMIMPLP